MRQNIRVKIESKFPLQVLATLVFGLGLAALFLAGKGEGLMPAVLAGAGLSALNVLAGFVSIEYSRGKSSETFLRAVLGGMVIRMMAMAAVLVALVKLAGLHMVALVVSLLGFYLVFLVLELMYIQRAVSTRK